MRVTVAVACSIDLRSRILFVDRELITRVGDVVVVQRTHHRRAQRGADMIRRRTGVRSEERRVGKTGSAARQAVPTTGSQGIRSGVTLVLEVGLGRLGRIRL